MAVHAWNISKNKLFTNIEENSRNECKRGGFEKVAEHRKMQIAGKKKQID